MWVGSGVGRCGPEQRLFFSKRVLVPGRRWDAQHGAFSVLRGIAACVCSAPRSPELQVPRKRRPLRPSARASGMTLASWPWAGGPTREEKQPVLTGQGRAGPEDRGGPWEPLERPGRQAVGCHGARA